MKPIDGPTIFGFRPGAVALACGQKGLTNAQTVKILTHYIKDQTFFVPNVRKFASDRVWRGARGKGGRPAELSEEQWDEVMSLLEPASKPKSLDPAALRYDERGLVPVIVQDVASGAVLMLAYADRRAVELTLATGEAHFWSRSRQALWRKGETSGNTLAVIEALADCDGDALLLRALPAGPACHRGTRSCFEPNAAALELGWLAAVAAGRRGADPERSYTARLLAAGLERVAQKVGEEAVETVVAALAAAARPERRGELVGESCDLLYHLLVLLLASGVPLAELAAELVRRHFAQAPAREPAAVAPAPAAPSSGPESAPDLPAGRSVR